MTKSLRKQIEDGKRSKEFEMKQFSQEEDKQLVLLVKLIRKHKNHEVEPLCFRQSDAFLHRFPSAFHPIFSYFCFSVSCIMSIFFIKGHAEFFWQEWQLAQPG